MIPYRLLHSIASRRRNFLIRNADGSPYLLRVLVNGRLCGEPETGNGSRYFHRMFSHDKDRLLHNHPWEWSWSLVVRGGYVEERREIDGTVRRRRLWPGMINVLGPRTFHRITDLKGAETWTFFRAGKKNAGWGFLADGDEFIPHRKHELDKLGKAYTPRPGEIPDFVFTCDGCGRYFLKPEVASLAFQRKADGRPVLVKLCRRCSCNIETVDAAVCRAIDPHPSTTTEIK